MAKLEIEIDATLIVNAFNKGLELGFMLANDDSELQTELNKNNISDAE